MAPPDLQYQYLLVKVYVMRIHVSVAAAAINEYEDIVILATLIIPENDLIDLLL